MFSFRKEGPVRKKNSMHVLGNLRYKQMSEKARLFTRWLTSREDGRKWHKKLNPVQTCPSNILKAGVFKAEWVARAPKVRAESKLEAFQRRLKHLTTGGFGGGGDLGMRECAAVQCAWRGNMCRPHEAIICGSRHWRGAFFMKMNSWKSGEAWGQASAQTRHARWHLTYPAVHKRRRILLFPVGILTTSAQSFYSKLFQCSTKHCY